MDNVRTGASHGCFLTETLSLRSILLAHFHGAQHCKGSTQKGKRQSLAVAAICEPRWCIKLFGGVVLEVSPVGF
jgi:hypothetical protein